MNSTEFKIVPENKEFKFKNLCPYCKGDLTYTANGWEQDNEGLWKADCFDMECSNEPSDVLSEELNEWLRQHSDLPYVYQLPVDERVKEYINERFRFKFND